MPETVRRTDGRLGSHPRQNGFRFAAAAFVIGILTVPARAEGAGLADFSEYIHALAALNRGEILAMVLTLGVLFFGVFTAILLVRTRIRAGSAESKLRDRIAALRADLDRAQTLLMSDPQVLVSWAAADNEPDILGDTTLITTASVPQRVLSFGSWLEPEKAQAMERSTDALRANGESFSMQLMTLNGRAIEADGRAIGGRAVLRLRDVSGFKRELAELNVRHEKLLSEVESLRTLIDALPSPVWARDNAGALTFVNTAYARAVEARDPADALTPGAGIAQPAGARGSQPRARLGQHLCRPPAGDRRRSPPHLRRDRRADAPGQRRHRHRRHRSRRHAQRAEASGRGASPHARPAHHRRRELQCRTASGFLQHGLSRAVGPGRGLPRPVSDRFRAARPASRRAQAAGGEGLPRMEGRAVRGLSRDRNPRAPLAPAGQPHAARRHHAQSAGRRDLSVRRRHREPAAGPQLRRADPRAAARRSTTWPKRSRCSAATAGCACTTRPSPPCGG